MQSACWGGCDVHIAVYYQLLVDCANPRPPPRLLEFRAPPCRHYTVLARQTGCGWPYSPAPLSDRRISARNTTSMPRAASSAGGVSTVNWGNVSRRRAAPIPRLPCQIGQDTATRPPLSAAQHVVD